MAGRRGRFRDLVDIAKMRWRIERDYQDLKREIGLATTKGAVGPRAFEATSVRYWASPLEANLCAGKVRAARWDRSSHPDKLPEYGASAFPIVWWWDAAKAENRGPPMTRDGDGLTR